MIQSTQVGFQQLELPQSGLGQSQLVGQGLIIHLKYKMEEYVFFSLGRENYQCSNYMSTII